MSGQATEKLVAQTSDNSASEMVEGNDNRPVAQDVGKTVKMDKNAESEKPAKGIPIKPVRQAQAERIGSATPQKRLVKRGGSGRQAEGDRAGKGRVTTEKSRQVTRIHAAKSRVPKMTKTASVSPKTSRPAAARLSVSMPGGPLWDPERVYPLKAKAEDAQGNRMPGPHQIVWSVSPKKAGRIQGQKITFTRAVDQATVQGCIGGSQICGSITVSIENEMKSIVKPVA